MSAFRSLAENVILKCQWHVLHYGIFNSHCYRSCYGSTAVLSFGFEKFGVQHLHHVGTLYFIGTMSGASKPFVDRDLLPKKIY